MVRDLIDSVIESLVSGMIIGLANFSADVVRGAFSVDSTNIDGSPATRYLAVSLEVGSIILFVAVPITIAAVIWQVIRSSSQARMSGVLRAVVGGVAVMILSRVVFWYGPELITGFDGITQALITSFQTSPGGINESLMGSLNFEKHNTTGAYQPVGGGKHWTAPEWLFVSSGIAFIALFLMAFLAFSAFCLMLMLSFRLWALIVLIGLAPLAFMFLPTEKASKAVVLKWLHIVVSLLAAKPLAAIILAVTAKMLASTGGLNLLMLLISCISFVVSGLAPLIAMKFFGFLGAEIGTAYAQAAGEGAMRTGAQKGLSGAGMMRNIMPRSGGGNTGGAGGGSPSPVTGSRKAPIPKAPAPAATGEPVSTVALATAQLAKKGVDAAQQKGEAAMSQVSQGGQTAPRSAPPVAPPVARHKTDIGAKTV